jgi:hypothetical protein
MIVGDEKPVPAQLENVMGVEAIWRLKTDTFRRTKRLISTLFHYCIGEIFGAYDNIKGKIINAQ